MASTYDHIKMSVESAGYFTTLRPRRHGGQQLIVASRQRPDGCGLCGNSFWISELDEIWYLGHWSSRIYIIPDAERVADFCLEWFDRVPNELPGDFDEHVKTKYGLIDRTEEGVPDSVWACDPVPPTDI